MVGSWTLLSDTLQLLLKDPKMLPGQRGHLFLLSELCGLFQELFKEKCPDIHPFTEKKLIMILQCLSNNHIKMLNVFPNKTENSYKTRFSCKFNMF